MAVKITPRASATGIATLISAFAAAGVVSPANAQEGVQAAYAPIIYAGAASASAPIDLRPGAMLQSAPAVISPAGAATRPAADPTRADSLGASFVRPHAGPPYQVEGRWYVPMHEPDYDEVGVASWYGPNFHGKLASNGEVYDQYAMTAAHPTLPIPSMVRVTNLENGRTITVKLNDRGPFIDDRIIDLSRAAAEAIDMTRKGTARVRVEYLGPVGSSQEPDAFLAKYVPPAGQMIQAAPITPIELAPRWSSEPAQPEAAPAVAGGEFFLQAGSFADLANAHKLKASLMSFGPVSVRAANVGGSEYYRVVLGPWPSRQDASDARDRLAATGTKAIIVE